MAPSFGGGRSKELLEKFERAQNSDKVREMNIKVREQMLELIPAIESKRGDKGAYGSVRESQASVIGEGED